MTSKDGPLQKWVDPNRVLSDENNSESGNRALNHDLVFLYRNLLYAKQTEKALDKAVLDVLIREVEILLSGRDSHLFKKNDCRITHPDDTYKKRSAVAYVNTCRKTKYDKCPIKTVCDVLGLKSRSNYYEWEKCYQDERDDLTEEELLHFKEFGYVYLEPYDFDLLLEKFFPKTIESKK